MVTEKKNISISISKRLIKDLLVSLGYAAAFTFVVYLIAVRPVEEFRLKQTYSAVGHIPIGDPHYELSRAEVEVPALLGKNFWYNPYKYSSVFNSKYPDVKPGETDNPATHCYRMPLLYRLYLVGVAMLNIKCLIFLLISWGMAYFIMWFMNHYKLSIRFKE